MKKLRLLAILPTIAVLLTGCLTKSNIPEEKEIDKTTLSYNYQDYASNSYYGLDVCPSNGTVNILVIPLWFTDSYDYITSTTHRNNVRSDIEKAFNSEGTELGWYSLSSYYKEESKGALNITATVSNWYECGYASSTFARNSNNTAVMVKTASDWFFTTTGESRSSYDSDSNGYLDGVILVYGCPDYASSGSANDKNLWAYVSWLTTEEYKNVSNPGPNVFMWASYDFMYNEDTAFERAGSYYGHGMNSYATLDSHTFIHEMGHVFGLEDYYDYSDNQYTPAGGFSMQDFNIGGHDPYSVLALGWGNPIIPTESVTVKISDFQSSHDVILLANHSVTSPFDEYMLIELYTPTGLNEFDVKHQYGSYPKGPAYPAIRLWHIDARLLYIYSSTRYSDRDLTDNPKTDEGRVLHAFSNSYDKNYGSPLANINSKYLDYNIVQLIRDKVASSTKPKDTVTNGVLFQQGGSYEQSDYSKQFVKGDKMNDGEELGWEFTINELNKNSATISLYKLSN